jgi:hypothetical protein
MHPNISKTVEPLLYEFQALPFVEKIILFGSRAFGDHEDRSDIDLALMGVISTKHSDRGQRFRGAAGHGGHKFVDVSIRTSVRIAGIPRGARARRA